MTRSVWQGVNLASLFTLHALAAVVALGALSGNPGYAQGIARPDSTSLNGPGNVFLTANTYATGGTPYPSAISVTIGDFNGDGKPDLAVSNGDQGGTVSILLGKGDGTFRPVIDTAQLNGSIYTATGDFNGDGKSDLAVITGGDYNGRRNILILLSNGDGTFTTKTTLSSLTNPVRAVSGDFNGDGKLDLAVVGQSSPSDIVYILLGKGDGTFQSPVTVSLGASVNAYQAVVADFNKDGHLDLAISEFNGPVPAAVHVLLGNGNGTFQAAQSFPIVAQGSGQGWGIAVGDFNNDGMPDLVATSPGVYGFTVLLGDGTGKFAAVPNPQTGTLPTAYATVPGGAATAIATGDFNNDGKLDVITGLSGINGAACVSIHLGNGDGTFQPQLLFGTAEFPASIAVADFNGDGKLDWVAVSNQTKNVVVALGRGDGTFLASRNFPTGNTPTWAAVADFNNDGNPDLVVPNTGDGNAIVLLGNGDGTFRTASTLSTSRTMNPVYVVTGDFNNDGNPDIIELNSPGGFADPCYGTQFSCLTVFLGKGDGTFQTPTVIGTGTGSVGLIVAGDFNGDGRLDLAAMANSTGPNPEVLILLGNGDGTFRALPPLPTGGQGIAWAAAGDVNKDGKLDLVVSDYYAGHVLIFPGKGDGTFQAPLTLTANLGVAGIALGDFNGDGNPDLVVSNEPRGYAEIWLGNGNGTFNSPTTITTNGSGIYGPRGLFAADFNLDGHLDLVFGHANNNIDGGGTIIGMSLMLGNGDGTFQPPQGYLVSRVAVPCAVADFDNDRTPDVILVDGSENILTVLLNQTPLPVQISAKSLAFGNQLVGAASSAQAITVTNKGSSPTPISIAVSGDFGQSSTCPVSPATLAAGAGCTINATFRPTAAGARNGTLTVSYIFPSSPQTVVLSGTGVAPAVTLSATNIAFGNQKIGTSSAPQVVGLTNTGAATLTISTIAITGANAGDFSQTNTCGGGVIAGGACYISVTFTPVAAGARSASWTIADNATGSPQTVTLSGTGVLPPVVPGGSVVNGASFASGQAVAPGALVSIFGTNLASTTAQADSIPLSTSRANVSVTFNSIPAPLLQVNHLSSYDQINAQLPWNVLPGGAQSGTAQVVVTNGGASSAPTSFQVVASAPGIFSLTGNGTGQAAAINNSDGTFAAPPGSVAGLTTHPAKIGDPQGVAIFATGLGAVSPAVANGDIPPNGVLSNAVTTPTVMVGNVPAQVLFSGMSPQYVGLNQINILLAPGTPTGNAVPLQLQVGGIVTTSQVTIAVSQ